MHKLTGKKKIAVEILVILLGASLQSLAVLIFIINAKIPLGGMMGIALIGNHFISLPIGLTIIALNLPLFLIGYKTIGKKFLWRTILAIVANAIFIDLLGPYIPTFEGDILLAAIFGGVFIGLGVGLIFYGGATSGGTDIISKLLKIKYGWSYGATGLYMNAAIILCGAVVYRSVEGALYALILQYITSTVIDGVLQGFDMSTGGFIITREPEKVAEAIMQDLGRGVTTIDAVGSYTQERKWMLLCAVRQSETFQLKRIVADVDPEAFVMLTHVQEVLGRGFKEHREINGSSKS
jgi:uncharacterized membrane-anchored protein YitT (DUF2179 family)